MPARRAIFLERTDSGDELIYQYCLWADVPSALQPVYRDPAFRSANRNATLSELSDLRAGIMAETVRRIVAVRGTPITTLQTSVEAAWQTHQNEVNAGQMWSDYGRWWNGTIWTAGTVPPDLLTVSESQQPTFFVSSGSQAFGANKFHLVLYNNADYVVVRVLLVVLQPGLSVVTGVMSSAWTLRRRLAPSTPPGGGLLTPYSTDTWLTLPTGITMHSAPTTSPAGGTAQDFYQCQPQADEVKLSTNDAPNQASLQPFGGVSIYDSSLFRPSIPLLLRTGQTLELQQSATAGTGNARTLCIFSVEDSR